MLVSALVAARSPRHPAFDDSSGRRLLGLSFEGWRAVAYSAHKGVPSFLSSPWKAAMKNEFSTVTTKGQLGIPSRLRRKYAIRKGTQVVFVEEENRLVLQPLTPEFIRTLRGSLKGEPSALKILRKERKRHPSWMASNKLVPGVDDQARKEEERRQEKKGPRSHELLRHTH